MALSITSFQSRNTDASVCVRPVVVIAKQAKAIAIARMLRMCFCFLKRMK
jgi:hypothetical protein